MSKTQLHRQQVQAALLDVSCWWLRRWWVYHTLVLQQDDLQHGILPDVDDRRDVDNTNRLAFARWINGANSTVCYVYGDFT